MSLTRKDRTDLGPVGTRPFSVKCYRPGCRRRKRGFLTTSPSEMGGGAFYNGRGILIADLREVDYACSEHGVGVGAFLYPDPPSEKVDYLKNVGGRPLTPFESKS